MSIKSAILKRFPFLCEIPRETIRLCHGCLGPEGELRMRVCKCQPSKWLLLLGIWNRRITMTRKHETAIGKDVKYRSRVEVYQSGQLRWWLSNKTNNVLHHEWFCFKSLTNHDGPVEGRHVTKGHMTHVTQRQTHKHTTTHTHEYKQARAHTHIHTQTDTKNTRHTPTPSHAKKIKKI